jgi:hypothetical protein
VGRRRHNTRIVAPEQAEVRARSLTTRRKQAAVGVRPDVQVLVTSLFGCSYIYHNPCVLGWLRATPVMCARTCTMDSCKGLLGPRWSASEEDLTSRRRPGNKDHAQTAHARTLLGLVQKAPDLGRQQPTKGGDKGHHTTRSSFPS